MATPHYVAKKIGDQYVLERKDRAAKSDDVLFAAVGGVLATCGFVRGGLLGKVATFVGGSMICRAVTGKNPFAGICCDPGARRLAAQPGGASHQNDARPTAQRPADAIDEAAMASFPASDPPARNAVSSVGASTTA